MRMKFFAFFTASVFLYASMVIAAPAPKQDDLAILLPESDGVMVVDVRRLFDEALPQILAANEPMRTKIDAEVDKIKSNTGLDLRRFDRLAIGMKSRQMEGGVLGLQPVMLARGPYDTGSLAEAAKMASKGNLRTEEVAGRTIYIFSAKEIVDRNKPVAGSGNSLFEKIFDKLLAGVTDEIALTAYDSSTVALGSPERVKELTGNSPRVGSSLLTMLGRKQNAVVKFGMIVPDGLSRYLELDDDELGRGLDSVREINGTLDVSPGKASLWFAARTADAEQAENLEIMLQGFQGLFAGILKQQKGADKKVYGRMLENLSVKRTEAELTIDLVIPQKDLDVIVGKK